MVNLLFLTAAAALIRSSSVISWQLDMSKEKLSG
ncbi:uncharacterized protein RAG0_12858 [Rhynchosporium agropyri]|uniref:Uncharacterized protein n=1 Tax=Rhynchosporium agropyri TaxID=914238 RepID=A0A1E1LA41_9HELO|nr:uncharacterized protein RAG0_12858 [Rhynchosporium agropyri]